VYAALVAAFLAAVIGVRIAQQRRPAARGGFIDLAPTTPATTVLESRADARAAR
jgi:hypothetical protein